MLTRVGWLDGWILILFSVYQALRAMVDSDPPLICKEIVKGFIKIYLTRCD
ncbi:MAG: hypothetical protein HLUCCO16_00890 [Phormidium sp. OSCR]|nr:MAG: hypothetical protein HLUCCO16_00890 [Phormidium sp. OSCR]